MLPWIEWNRQVCLRSGEWRSFSGRRANDKRATQKENSWRNFFMKRRRSFEQTEATQSEQVNEEMEIYRGLSATSVWEDPVMRWWAKRKDLSNFYKLHLATSVCIWAREYFLQLETLLNLHFYLRKLACISAQKLWLIDCIISICVFLLKVQLNPLFLLWLCTTPFCCRIALLFSFIVHLFYVKWFILFTVPIATLSAFFILLELHYSNQ